MAEGNTSPIIAIIILFAVIIIILAFRVKIVLQAYAYVIECLGSYQRTWSVGVHLELPILDWIVKGDCVEGEIGDVRE